MGGPIKEGIMHGIREPKKDGGTPGVGYGLVGDKRYPKTGGREHHWAFLPWLIGAGGTALRTAPTVYRGMKAARTLAPGNLASPILLASEAILPSSATFIGACPFSVTQK